MPATRILLVDDDESFRPALQKTLERLGFTVTASPHGADAKAKLLTTTFDLIVSDIRMPEMDGIELTRFVKAMMRTTPIILITGFSDILEARTAYDLGADAFLAKPVDREELSAAIHACIGTTPEPTVHEEDAESFCRLSVDDFMSGAQIQFNVFIQLSEHKFVKIAHRGEDLSYDRIGALKVKGLRFLYLRSADFRAYVNFSVVLSAAVRGSSRIPQDKKLNLLKHTGEIIQAQINYQGIDAEIYDAASSFVQTTVQVMAEDPDAFALLEILNAHGDHAYAHGVGTSLYSVMMAQKVGWNMPTNRFKVAMGALLHDIGEHDIPRELLLKPRPNWTRSDFDVFETHPARGVAMLSSVGSVPLDVLQVVKQHHEACNGTGFPERLRKNRIHPMARLVSVASEFCAYVVRNEKGPGISPRDAAIRMQALWADRIDPEFFGALTTLFRLGDSEAVS